MPGFAIPGKLLIAYPLVPWLAVMALGFALASCYRWDSDQRRVFFISMGIVATAMHCVSSVPYVCSAEPGIRTYLDLPLVAGRAAQ